MKYKNIVEKYKNTYIGLWVDNGLIYLDISKHYNSKKRAIQAGIQNEQLAIYDIKKGESIDLTKKTYILYRYNALNNDIIYMDEFLNLDELKSMFNIKNLHQYINKSCDNIKHILMDKFVIIEDKILISEMI
jgi:hypothetical protein